jgi:hypothetical protein
VEPSLEDSQTLKGSIADIYPASPRKRCVQMGNPHALASTSGRPCGAIIKIRVECAGSILQPI